VIRTSSEVDNQSAENEASNEGDYYPKGQHYKKMRRRNIRLIMEKTNSAETYHIEFIFFWGKASGLTFPEVPDTENIGETDKETEDRSIGSLMLMLVGAYFQPPRSMSEKSTYIIVPVSEKYGRSRDLYGGSDTAGSSSTKA
jgi:hypothetical protein